MRASDVMTFPVITVKPSDSVKKVAELFIKRGISATPVVDDHGKLVGMITEGDLLHRAETGTEREHPRLVRFFTGEHDLAKEYIKSHALKVIDLMTRDVLSATPDTPLQEIATLMEKKAIKRLPILSNGQLVGIVSRANLVQAIATTGAKLEIPLSDSVIREKILAHFKTLHWAHTSLINPIVTDGIVNLWGVIDSSVARTAVRVATETIPGVRAVNDHMMIGPLQ